MGEYGQFDATTLTDALRPLYADLRRFAAVVGGMDVEPDDVVQEALVRLLVSGRLGSLDDAGAFLRREIVDLVSNERRPTSREHGVSALAPVEVVLVADYPPDLADFGSLDPMTRALLCLVELDGMPRSQAAATLRCRGAAARSRLSRARRRLQAAFDIETVDA